MERVLLYRPHHKSRAYVPGTLCLTDRHIIFLEPTALDETWVITVVVLSLSYLLIYPVVILLCSLSHTLVDIVAEMFFQQSQEVLVSNIFSI